MTTPKDTQSSTDYHIQDADDHNGIVPEDALQKANPSTVEQVVDDQDPHHVVKDHKQYDTPVTESNKPQS